MVFRLIGLCFVIFKFISLIKSDLSTPGFYNFLFSNDLQPIVGFGVAKVLDSKDEKLKKGDLIWGLTGWEEYSLINNAQGLFKIEHTDVPLSYYTGFLGKCCLSLLFLFNVDHYLVGGDWFSLFHFCTNFRCFLVCDDVYFPFIRCG